MSAHILELTGASVCHHPDWLHVYDDSAGRTLCGFSKGDLFVIRNWRMFRLPWWHVPHAALTRDCPDCLRCYRERMKGM